MHQDILLVAAVPVRYKDIVIDIAKSVQIFFCQLPAPVRKRGCPPELAQAGMLELYIKGLQVSSHV